MKGRRPNIRKSQGQPPPPRSARLDTRTTSVVETELFDDVAPLILRVFYDNSDASGPLGHYVHEIPRPSAH